jgi:hypothetical protein
MTAAGTFDLRTYANVLSDIGASASGHNHDAAYSAIGHDHDADYADISHNHSGVYQPADAELTGLAALSYSAAGFVRMTAAGTFDLRTYANVLSDIGASASGHNHDAAYAAIGHDHASTYVAKSLFDANTILMATSDDTPVALAVGTNTLVGRIAGNIVAFDIDDLTADGSPNGAADYVMTWDADASAHKKVLLSNVSAAHTHDGGTLQLDGINSDGGAFSFTTTGDVTFNHDLIIPNFITCGNEPDTYIALYEQILEFVVNGVSVFNFAQLTGAIWINGGSNDLDFVVYGDTGALITTDAGAMTVAFGGNISAPNASLGTGELTAGSINRASGALTLEIGGVAEQTITATETTFSQDVIISGGDLTISPSSSISDIATGNANSLMRFSTDRSTSTSDAFRWCKGDGTELMALQYDGVLQVSGRVIAQGDVETVGNLEGAKLVIEGTATPIATFTSTVASGLGSGAGMAGISDDGAALASGDRLGYYAFGGAVDAAHTIYNAAAITSFTSEAWGATKGAEIRCEVTANGAGSRVTALTIASDGISFTGTSKIKWTGKRAASVTATAGTPHVDHDTVADLQYHGDGLYYQIYEVSASDVINLLVTFTGITAFNWVQLYARYQGVSSNNVWVEMWNVSTSSYEIVGFVYPQDSSQTYENNSFMVEDCDDYINSGTVLIRLQLHGTYASTGYFLAVESCALF